MQHIGPMVKAIGRLVDFCVAIDAEVTRRKGDMAKPVSSNPDALAPVNRVAVLTPLQQAAVRLAERRRAARLT
jgi:hypothetical protein